MAHAVIPVLPKFTRNGENEYDRWDLWKEDFKLYATAAGLTSDAERNSLLILMGGDEVKRTFKTFEIEDLSAITHAELILKFDAKFTKKRNLTYERHVFRAIKQTHGECMDDYVTRLQYQALLCNWGTWTESAIVDQIVEHCSSSKLRRRLLREADLKLDMVLTLARNQESSDRQAAHMEAERPAQVQSDSVHYITKTQHQRSKPPFEQERCSRCGWSGHSGTECTITKGKTCNRCSKEGHFANVCRAAGDAKPRHRPEPRPAQHRGKWRAKVNCVLPGSEERKLESETESSDDDEYAFMVSSSALPTAQLNINGQLTPIVIDSGATISVLTEEKWKLVKREGDTLMPTNVRAFSYDSGDPMDLLGEVFLPVSTKEIKRQVRFVVAKPRNKDHPCLLGKNDALGLELIKFSEEVVFSTLAELTVDQVLQKHDNVFTGLGKLKGVLIDLELKPDAVPKALPVRRMPFHLRDKVEQEIQRLLDIGVIEKVVGPTPWLSPVVPVPKKDGSIRLCLDVREPNKALVKQKFPIPTVDDVLAEIGEADVFTELDFTEGFHQVELSPAARRLTAFAVESGVYHFKRLIFGITVAPEIFQNLVQQVLTGCEGARNISDNILVYSRGQALHAERLDQVLSKLGESGFKLNRKKCHFAKSQLAYMGLEISPGGITLDKMRIEHLNQLREPLTVSDLRGFLGLVNFCSRFIPRVADITKPLRDLTCKNVEWVWTEEHKRAFITLKVEIARQTQLMFFHKDRPTFLYVDASPIGLGAVLAQLDGKDNMVKPVAFASKALTPTECRYSQTEKEALSVIWGCEKFSLFLIGREFTILTDHKPLLVLYSPKSRPAARIERWGLRLQGYHYSIEYVKGVNNIADSLSRLFAQREPPNEAICLLTEAYMDLVVNNAVPKTLTLAGVKKATADDIELLAVRDALESGEWSGVQSGLRRVRDELAWREVLLRGTRMVLPSSLRQHAIQVAHEGHQGLVKTKALLRSKVWWPDMDGEAEALIKDCVACQLNTEGPKGEPVTATTWSTKPWQHLALDLCGPFPDGSTLAVLVDYFTKWPEAVLLKSTTSSVIVNWLDNVFAVHGYPECITCDNGPQFQSNEFKNAMKELGIKIRFTTPYWPQANGQVERLNRVFLKAFRAAACEGKELKKALTTFLRVYRTTPHTITKVSPAELLFNRQVRTKLPSTAPVKLTKQQRLARDNILQAGEKNEAYINAKRQLTPGTLKVGDFVMVHQARANKLSAKYNSIPFEVIDKFGGRLKLRHPSGKIWERNASAVKLAPPSWQQHVETELNSSDSEDDLPEQQGLPAQHGPNPIQREEADRPRRVTKPPTWLRDFKC